MCQYSEIYGKLSLHGSYLPQQLATVQWCEFMLHHVAVIGSLAKLAVKYLTGLLECQNTRPVTFQVLPNLHNAFCGIFAR